MNAEKSSSPVRRSSLATTDCLLGPSAPTLVGKQDRPGQASVSIKGVTAEEAQRRLMDAINTNSPEFLEGILSQLANASSRGQMLDEKNLNFTLAVVAGIEPRDHTEALLAAQMAAVHLAVMRQARVLAHIETIAQQDSAERALTKLVRAFATQVEALRRYRSNGEQTVRVEHVTINAGGQAVVGPLSVTGGREKSEKQCNVG